MIVPVQSIKPGHGEKRSRKQELAVLALLSEPNFEVAADKVGVSKSTLWRWMQTEGFQEHYREAKLSGGTSYFKATASYFNRCGHFGSSDERCRGSCHGSSSSR